LIVDGASKSSKASSNHHFLAFLQRPISDQHVRPRISRRRSAIDCIRLVYRRGRSDAQEASVFRRNRIFFRLARKAKNKSDDGGIDLQSLFHKPMQYNPRDYPRLANYECVSRNS
jgi:hypothetical protein